MSNPHELRAHILSLAAAFKITLIESSYADVEDAISLTSAPIQHVGKAVVADMSRVQHQVYIHTVVDERTYAVALHELGHCIHPSGVVRNVVVPGSVENQNLKIVEEESAWEWAVHHALCWTAEMEAAKQFGLRSYDRSQPLQERRRQSAQPVPPRRPSESIDDFLKRRK